MENQIEKNMDGEWETGNIVGGAYVCLFACMYLFTHIVEHCV